MSGNVRALAAEVLCLVEGGGFADAIIDGTIRGEGIQNPSDAALLTELVMGVLRNRLVLDKVITRYLSKRIEKTDEFVLNALRIGTYQILFLSRIPPHAALNETIEAVKRKKGMRLAGFANGVLRNFLRDDDRGEISRVRRSFPPNVQHSVPTWMMGDLRRYFDEERLERVLEKFSSRPPPHVRINTLKADRDRIYSSLREEGVPFLQHPFAQDCLTLEDPPPLHRFRPLGEGLITPQDAGSVLVTRMVADMARSARESGGKLLDACSAPGIKTSYLRSLLPRWDLWATDVSDKRIESMRENFARMGVVDVTIQKVDFTEGVPEDLRSAFDVVFVDSPCSGLGVMRRNPEVKWRIGARDVDRCAEKAKIILENALQCVKEGGFCLYSTCTFTGSENEELVKAVSESTGCVVESVREVLPQLPDGMDTGLFTMTAPDLFNSDFFFLARLKKGGEVSG